VKKKVFLYLYPIQEFFDTSFHPEEFYRSFGLKYPFPILNECIQKRYREKGYEVVFATYPDREVKVVDVKNEDRVILTDITFKEASGYYEDGSEKSRDEIRYPDSKFLIDQLGEIDSLVVGGFHACDCVKRVADYAYDIGIDTLVDYELTESFGYYLKQEFFEIDKYNPANIRELIRYYAFTDYKSEERRNDYLERFKNNFSPVYHFFDERYTPTVTAEEMIAREYQEDIERQQSERTN